MGDYYGNCSKKLIQTSTKMFVARVFKMEPISMKDIQNSMTIPMILPNLSFLQMVR